MVVTGKFRLVSLPVIKFDKVEMLIRHQHYRILTPPGLRGSQIAMRLTAVLSTEYKFGSNKLITGLPADRSQRLWGTLNKERGIGRGQPRTVGLDSFLSFKRRRLVMIKLLPSPRMIRLLVVILKIPRPMI